MHNDAIIPRPVTQIESRFFGLFSTQRQSKSGHVRVRARILYVYCGAHIRSDPVVAFPLNISPFFEKRDTVQIFALLK